MEPHHTRPHHSNPHHITTEERAKIAKFDELNGLKCDGGRLNTRHDPDGTTAKILEKLGYIEGGTNVADALKKFKTDNNLPLDDSLRSRTRAVKALINAINDGGEVAQNRTNTPRDGQATVERSSTPQTGPATDGSSQQTDQTQGNTPNMQQSQEAANQIIALMGNPSATPPVPAQITIDESGKLVPAQSASMDETTKAQAQQQIATLAQTAIPYVEQAAAKDPNAATLLQVLQTTAGVEQAAQGQGDSSANAQDTTQQGPSNSQQNNTNQEQQQTTGVSQQESEQALKTIKDGLRSGSITADNNTLAGEMTAELAQKAIPALQQAINSGQADNRDRGLLKLLQNAAQGTAGDSTGE